MVTGMSPYLDQHEVIDKNFWVVPGMRNLTLNLDDLPGIVLCLIGAHPQVHILKAARAGNTAAY